MIRHENGAFRKKPFKPEEFENAGQMLFSVDREHFENKAF